MKYPIADLREERSDALLCPKPETVYITHAFASLSDLSLIIAEKGWLYVWPADPRSGEIEGAYSCHFHYYAVRHPYRGITQSQLVQKLERFYEDAFEKGCHSINEKEFAVFGGVTPEEFLEGKGDRAKALDLTELGSVDFTRYSTAQKRCCTISQSAWQQKAVVHTFQLYSVRDITKDETAKHFYLEVRCDEYKNLTLHLFEDYGLICALIDYIPRYYTVQTLADLIHDFAYKTYAGRRGRLDQIMAQPGGYVNLADIRIAELMGEPAEYVNLLKGFRQKRLEQKQREYEEEGRKRAQKKTDEFEKQKKKLQDIVDAAVKIIREGGTLKNTSVYVPYTEDNGLNTSLFLFLLRLHQIHAPLRTQGWINSALISADFAGGGCTSLSRYSGSKPSKVVFQYLEQLAATVCKSA